MGLECGTLTNPSRGFPPTRWVGESGVIKLGMRFFQRLQLAHHRVVLGVGDFGRVEHVIQMLVMPQFLAQGLNFVGDAGQNGESLQFRRIRLRGSISANRNWLAVPILLLTMLTDHV